MSWRPKWVKWVLPVSKVGCSQPVLLERAAPMAGVPRQGLAVAAFLAPGVDGPRFVRWVRAVVACCLRSRVGPDSWVSAIVELQAGVEEVKLAVDPRSCEFAVIAEMIKVCVGFTLGHMAP